MACSSNCFKKEALHEIFIFDFCHWSLFYDLLLLLTIFIFSDFKISVEIFLDLMWWLFFFIDTIMELMCIYSRMPLAHSWIYYAESLPLIKGFVTIGNKSSVLQNQIFCFQNRVRRSHGGRKFGGSTGSGSSTRRSRRCTLA